METAIETQDNSSRWTSMQTAIHRHSRGMCAYYTNHLMVFGINSSINSLNIFTANSIFSCNYITSEAVQQHFDYIWSVKYTSMH